MLEVVDYACLLQYSPRANSPEAVKSRTIRDAIKGGRIQTFGKRMGEIIEENKESLQPFLHAGVTLVPAPRSSLVRETDLWPALEICRMLADMGYGEVAPCLIRTEAIRKSSLYFNADERPSIAEQYQSLSVLNDVPSANITLVDDILTLGRTTMAGASRLAEKFPNASIRVFGLMQTRGFDADIDSILKVRSGTITYHPSTGKCSREP